MRICDALGLLFAALLVFFQIRHALNDGDPLAPTSGHVEQGLFALTSLGFAAVLIRMDLARANPVFRVASLIFGVISGLVTLFGLGLIENPLFSREPVRGPVVFSSLLLAYLLPALAAVVLARTARGVRPHWYVTGAAVLALLLLFGYVTLEVRHAFQGENLDDLAEHGCPRDLVLLGGLAGPRPGLPRLRPVARLQGGAAGFCRAGRAVGDQGVPLRPDGHRRLLARVLRHLPGRRSDRHRPRLPEADLCQAAAATGHDAATATRDAPAISCGTCRAG